MRVLKLLFNDFKKLPFFLKGALIVFLATVPCYLIGFFSQNGDLYTLGIIGLVLSIEFFALQLLGMLAAFVYSFIRKSPGDVAEGLPHHEKKPALAGFFLI